MGALLRVPATEGSDFDPLFMCFIQQMVTPYRSSFFEFPKIENFSLKITVTVCTCCKFHVRLLAEKQYLKTNKRNHNEYY